MTIALTRKQVRHVDELAIHRYGIPGVILMENAGRNAAAIIDRSYGPAGKAFVCCGTGNNGGDGCVIARHLHNAGWSVRLLLAGDPARMSNDTRTNFHILAAMGLNHWVTPNWEEQHLVLEEISPEDVLVDALLGTGFSGEVRSPLAELINAVNAAPRRAVVAVDLPSGFDCDSGTPSRATIHADLTITFVAAKVGFFSPQAASYIGRVEVADIGAPRELIARIVAGEE